MFHNINQDCLEIILKSCDIQTYYNFMLTDKTILKNVQQIKINYFFAKKRLKNIYNNSQVKYCTNNKCPNKLHLNNIKTSLTEKNLDIDLIFEYKNILSNLKGNNRCRFDKTITYEFSNLKKILRITDIPYCEDCLLEYKPELYEFVHENYLLIY